MLFRSDTGIETTLWHRRLGHLSEKNLSILHRRELLPGLKKVNLEFCEECIYGKQKAVSFQLARTQKKTERLKLVHSDVWGPAPVASYAGNTYFVTFIDDFSKKVWVFAMKEKPEVFGIFKRWRVMCESQTGTRLKYLKTDNGGEYCSREFDVYCTEHGIRRIKVVLGTPQQNGVAKRMNRVIFEKERKIGRAHV